MKYYYSILATWVLNTGKNPHTPHILVSQCSTEVLFDVYIEHRSELGVFSVGYQVHQIYLWTEAKKYRIRTLSMFFFTEAFASIIIYHYQYLILEQ